MLQCSEGNVAVGFSGPRNYSGDLYLGFSFNVPTLKLLMLSKQEIAEKFAILDIEAWATHLEQLWQGIRTYRLF
jgi:hypothetical protein